MNVVAEIVVSEIIDEQEYVGLLARTLPHVIHTEEENERCIAALEALDSSRDLSVEEKRIAELLTLLIEDFEGKNYTLPSASPLEIVRHLMDSNGLRQVDMVDVFGSASIASEVLNGKRDLAKAHIERLSHRFNVSPALFFPQARVAVEVGKVAATRRQRKSAGRRKPRA
jgi:HTH-type transcriptional regulator/antitoxin HigA